jgi:hypothetical protein
MSESPSPTGSNGRSGGGRIAPGNKVAKGNPHAKRVARLRSALLKAVSPADLRDVVTALLASAKGGDVPAAKELLQRLLGPPESIDLMERLDGLEATLAKLSENKEESWRR